MARQDLPGEINSPRDLRLVHLLDKGHQWKNGQSYSAAYMSLNPVPANKLNRNGGKPRRTRGREKYHKSEFFSPVLMGTVLIPFYHSSVLLQKVNLRLGITWKLFYALLFFSCSEPFKVRKSLLSILVQLYSRKLDINSTASSQQKSGCESLLLALQHERLQFHVACNEKGECICKIFPSKSPEYFFLLANCGPKVSSMHAAAESREPSNIQKKKVPRGPADGRLLCTSRGENGNAGITTSIILASSSCRGGRENTWVRSKLEAVYPVHVATLRGPV